MWLYLSTIFNILLICNSLKPTNKEKLSAWTLECEMGIISDEDCPVDGAWSSWSLWSPCSGPCNHGHRHRSRQCTNPSPSNDGLPCIGPNSQTESCHRKNCTYEDYQKLLEGDHIRTQALEQLNLFPFLINYCLNSNCPFETVEAATASGENTYQISPELLWNTLQCVLYNIGCSIKGGWSNWGDWSSCGARCGYGLRWRFRRCDTPPPSEAQFVCIGTPLHVEECQGDHCAVNSKRELSGTWSSWGQWSACSEKCGPGVRQRKRFCNEINSQSLFCSWGTHCRGQKDQFEVCDNKDCKLDGGWSGWSLWGPCSQSCGPGKRFRSRSCTRPVPSESGLPCVGPKSEIGFCHLGPCESLTHNVAVFNGESFLHYNFTNRYSSLFHFYVRFLPLSPNGVLVRRGRMDDCLVRLSLRKWHLCLDAGGLSTSCTVPTICTHLAIEPAIWHTALITVTSEGISLRLDDEQEPRRSIFSCNPKLPNKRVDIIVGEKFRGEIQEIILNFMPLSLTKNRKNENVSRYFLVPTKESNVAHEKATGDESDLILENNLYMRIPCFDDQNEWSINLTLKPKADSGTIVFLHDINSNSWIHLFLENMRMILKVNLKGLKSERSSSSEYIPDQWVDVAIFKQLNLNAIETTINAVEPLHVLFDDIIQKPYNYTFFNEIKMNHPNLPFCTDEFFVGGIPEFEKKYYNISLDLISLSGTIASVKINDQKLDLSKVVVERFKNGIVQVSSRTASISGSYHEIVRGTNNFNLTCLYSRTIQHPTNAYWLNLDIVANDVIKDKKVRSVNDGRVLRLVTSAENNLKGFYTCRSHRFKRSQNIVTYGILEKIQNELSNPDMTTAIAVITTATLVLGTLLWLIMECIQDIRDGFGFFRDAHLTPKEEAEAICKFIDQNLHMYSNKTLANISKARARQIGRQMSSTFFAKQGPKELLQIENFTLNEKSDKLDKINIPDIKGPSNQILKYQDNCVSSAHGSVSNKQTNQTSILSSDLVTPSIYHAQMYSTKKFGLKKPSSMTKKSRVKNGKPNFLTIQPSTIKNITAQKVLLKFKQLKSDDQS